MKYNQFTDMLYRDLRRAVSYHEQKWEYSKYVTSYNSNGDMLDINLYHETEQKLFNEIELFYKST